MTDELLDWWLCDDGRRLEFQTGELEALSVCFPHLDLGVELTLETFATVVWRYVTDRCGRDGTPGDARWTVLAEDRETINAMLNLWRQQIERLQAKVDALPVTEPTP